MTTPIKLKYRLFSFFKFQDFVAINQAAGRTVVHQFPDGYSAHWIRAIVDKDTKASVQFLYS